MRVNYTGEFETHFTVRLGSTDEIADLYEWGQAHGLKGLHIILGRGEVTSQPMLTRRGRGTFFDELEIATALGRDLEAVGYSVTRIKIEAAPGAVGIPQTDIEAAPMFAERYFEHHLKILINDQVDLIALGGLAEQHAAHLSRNARRVRPDGLREWFVTQRCWSMGQHSADRRLDELLAALSVAGYCVVKVEKEFVVHDSNLAIDRGWISSGGAL